MNIKLNINALKSILTKYFSETLGSEYRVEIICNKKAVGYYSEEVADTKVKLIGYKKIFGEKIQVELTLTEKEIKEALANILKQEGLEAKSIDIISYLEKEASGYGLCERYESVPKLKIEIVAEEIGKTKKYTI